MSTSVLITTGSEKDSQQSKETKTNKNAIKGLKSEVTIVSSSLHRT